MTSMFFMQGLGLDLSILKDSPSTQIPVSSLRIFNVFAVVILVPLFDRIIYPALRKINIDFGMLKRIGAGMVIIRSEEHTSELQSLMRSSYAVFCLKQITPLSYHRTCVLSSPISERHADSFSPYPLTQRDTHIRASHH